MSYANPLLERPLRGTPRRIGVIGAGSIGPDIAYYLKSALPALELTLIDIRQEAIDAALARLAGYAEKAVARGKMSADAARATLAGLTGSTDYDALAGCDWVLEAATEDLALKRRIFADVEARVAPDAVITSNTSSLPAARIFAGLAHPQRATVTHFFAPAWRNPAVEVIDWPGADAALVAWLRHFFAATGKLPLATTDAPCFMLDRVFDNWCNDAALLLGDATAAEIDSVAGEFVHAGPFFVLNLAHGNPIITETNTLQAEEEGAHYRPAPIFRSVDRWLTVGPGKSVTVAPDVAADRDAAPGELADPVGWQRAFVELAQFHHVLAARADQQLVDAGPDRGAVALAAWLGAGGDDETVAVVVEAVALQALLRQHVGHHFGMGDRAVLRHHAIDADRDEPAHGREHGRAERATGTMLDIAACQLDREADLGRVILVQALRIDMLAQPQRQGQVQLRRNHRAHLPATLAQVSRSVTVRLNTGRCGVWSRRSAVK